MDAFKFVEFESQFDLNELFDPIDQEIWDISLHLKKGEKQDDEKIVLPL
jgi:hypothetical protein